MFTTRSYNSLKLINGILHKTCPTDRAINETRWFFSAQKYIPKNLPKIFSSPSKVNERNSEYTMEQIDGVNLYQYSIENKLDTKSKRKILDAILELALDKMNIDNTQQVLDSDIDQMYFEKPYMSAKNYISEMNLDNKPLQRLEEIFNKLRPSLYGIPSKLIHGDLTFGNIIIDNSQKLYLIDPRGKFGKTLLFGDKNYDLAKIYFSIVGSFESLNNNKFESTKNYRSKKFRYKIENSTFLGLEEYFLKRIEVEPTVIKYIHSTIWLSLPPHMSDNLVKARVAFENGVKYLSEINL